MLRYKPHIPKNPSQVMDKLGFMVLKAPTFEDSFFVGRNVETVFFALNSGIDNIRKGLGEEDYATLTSLSEQARAHFEADPSNNNGRTREGRKLLYEMQFVLERRWAYLAPNPENADD